MLPPARLNANIPATWSIFAALALLGVLGRIFQPQWNVTPIAAVTLFAAALFAQRWMAVLLPCVILAVSNLFLADYSSRVEMLAVYVCFVAPAFWGTWLITGSNTSKNANLGAGHGIKFTASIILASVASSTLFYVVTNFAVWLIRRGNAYEDSLAGLLECYAAAVPFYRWMLQGDLLYCGLVFGSAAVLQRVGKWQHAASNSPRSTERHYCPVVAQKK
ncbi:MAG: DUF6580 family putative transport protein [Pirellulales bacterium]|nr:DUF6580 family putative transport protein [Pirellulales bacterium]